MALGSVAVSGGMSKQEKERMMYMDGKLVWSTAMGTSGGTNTNAPAAVDYLVVRAVANSYSIGTNNFQTSPGATEVRVARGGSAAIGVSQSTKNGTNAGSSVRYSVIKFASNGAVSLTWPGDSVTGCISVEGYQYL